MDWKQICPDALQALALECCPAELHYDLSDDIEQVDEETLWLFIEDAQGEGLSPYLLGRLACLQGVNSLQHDPYMMDLLDGNIADSDSKSDLMKQWFDGWSREYAVLSE